MKRNALAPDELIAAVRLPPARGPQQFAKVGTRNAMVIAVSSFALALHPDRRTVGTGIGSAAPTPRRAPPRPLRPARSRRDRGPRAPRTAARFGALVAAAAAHPSTTCAAPPPTAGTPWPCSAAARWPGPGATTGGRR